MNGNYSDLWGEAADDLLTDEERARLRAGHRRARRWLETYKQRQLHRDETVKRRNNMNRNGECRRNPQ